MLNTQPFFCFCFFFWGGGMPFLEYCKKIEHFIYFLALQISWNWKFQTKTVRLGPSSHHQIGLLLRPAKRRVVVTLGRVGSLLSIHSSRRVLATQRASTRTGVSKGQKGGTALTNHLNSHSDETCKLSCLWPEPFSKSSMNSHGQGVPAVWFGWVRFGVFDIFLFGWVWFCMFDIYLLKLNSAGDP